MTALGATQKDTKGDILLFGFRRWVGGGRVLLFGGWRGGVIWFLEFFEQVEKNSCGLGVVGVQAGALQVACGLVELTRAEQLTA
jgi:hypothetical protein